MDFQSTNMFEIWKEMGMLTLQSIKNINNGLELQTMKLDGVYRNLINQAAQRELFNNCGLEKKLSKKSKVKNVETGDLFSAESNFQQPAVPPLRRTKRQASMLAVEKIRGVRESATISSSGGCSTRASRARAISTFIEDSNPFNGPKANSTFVIPKKDMGNVEEFLSPHNMFSPEKDSNIKPTNANHTYNIKIQSKTNLKKKSDKTVDLITEDSSSKSGVPKVSTRTDSKKNSVAPEKIDKQREKLEDIDVNIKEQSPQTRTKKRKLQEENQMAEICVKKANVIHVPLEIQTSTPNKPLDVPQTPHQIRENEAEKRKELYLKSKADKKKFEDQHLKVTKQREVQMKLAEEKFKKTAEDKKKKEEAQRLKELKIKEELLKKQKQQAELNSKRKQALEARVLKKKEEIDRKVKESELKKKNELKLVKNLPEVVNSPLRSALPKPIAKTAVLPKTKTGNNEIDKNENDYDLNDMSAQDSSDDESGPKKKVPSWAIRENRAPVLELQYHVDAQERDAFFNCPKIMDLQKTFEGWPIRNRQRTSSAVWNTPPRFSEYIRNQC
ncbi:Hypothetical protein CINCED_3A004368 [Cinara cedri]|nr:Hypothetical protein CINCED_3A004368 [Cinara cedri]